MEKNICTLTGLRSEAMKRTWSRIKELEAKGQPTVSAWGKVFKEIYRDLKAEALKACSGEQ